MAQAQEVFLFNPTQISGCRLWLDASDPATCLRSGTSITNWNDKSGTGNNITIGGSGGLQFGNASGNVGASNSVNTVSGLTSYFTVPLDIRKTVLPNLTVFIVYAWLGAGGGPTAQTFWGNDNPNNGNRTQHFDYSSVYAPNSYGYFLNNGYLYNETELNKSTTQLYGLVSQVGVTNGTGVYFNGTLGSAGVGSELVNTPDAENATLFFGGGETSSIFPSYTQFNEILIYTTALTISQRQTIEGYLAWKWSLQGLLSSTHPYARNPPYANQPFPLIGVPVPPLKMTIQPVFIPTQISGCQLWLDASDRSSLSLSGNTVVGWQDKSGLGKTVTFVGSANTYNASTSSVNTDNATTSYFYANVNLKKSVVTYANVFIVYSWTGSGLSGTNQALWGQDIGGGWNRFQLLGFTATPAFAYGLSYTPNSPNVTTVSALNTSSRVLYFANYEYLIPNSTSVNVNGSLASALVTEAVSPSETSTTNTYFGTIDTGYAGTVAFNEIIINTSLLTVPQIQQIEGYLAWKWGHQGSLPATHPYKNSILPQFPYPSIPFSGGGFLTSWIPTNISSLALWLDASDGNTLTLSGTNIIAWNDKSGNANNASVPGGGVPPTYTTNSLNRMPTVSFNGSTDVLKVNNNFNMTTFPSLCYFIVIRPASSQPNVNYAGILSTDAPGQFGRTLGFGGGNWQQEYYNSFTNITPYTANVWAFVSLQFTSTISATLAVNGNTFAGTPTGTKDNTNGFHIGTYNNDGGYNTFGANFETAEILVYGANLSTPQRQQVEGYLAWKWGLQASLPANHPFKLFPPSP